MYVLKLSIGNRCTTAQSNILIFGRAMLKKKRVKLMTSFVRNAIFGISNRYTPKKCMSPQNYPSQMTRKTCHTTHMQHLHSVTLFDLALTLIFTQYKACSFMDYSLFLEKHDGRVFIHIVVFVPHSVAAKVKGAVLIFNLILS